MFRFARATGFAVASLIVAASATYAGPSFAEEAVSADIPTFLDHGSAAPIDAAATESAPAPAAQAYDPDFSAPVAEHAVATMTSDAATEGSDSRSLSQQVEAYASADAQDAQLECLAGAVYFESKGEPLQGQLAVAEVILNRAGSGKYPASICGVVKQKSQFSFVRGGQIPHISKDSPAWRKAVAIAHIAKQDLNEAGIGKAMFFHARYVSPGWSGLTRVASIGNHIFYR